MNQVDDLPSTPDSLLRSLLASSGDCIKILDLDGNLIYMTDGGQRLMEVADFDTIKGCPWPDFWRDQGNLDAQAAVKTAKSGVAARFQGFAKTMGGTPKWWDVHVSPIFDDRGKPEKLLAVSRDMTLADSEAQFKMFAQAMPNQIWSSTPDGQFDWFNDKVFEYSGLRFDDLKGSGWGQIVHSDDIAAATAGWVESLANATQYQAQFRLRRADGSWRWYLARALPITNRAGGVARWIGTNTDIDDQKVAEADLRESELRAAAAVDAADIGTWDFNPRTGSLKWDKRCYELFGLAVSKPVTFDVFLAGVHPADRKVAEQACRDAMRPENPQPYDIEYRTIGLDDGVERWVSAKGKGYFENGEAVRFIGTVRDISKLKQAETQQKLLTHELEHRMKNTMAVVSAIATQTFRTATTKEEARTIFEARLHVLSNAHDILTKSSWTTASMPIVVDGALAPHRSGEGRITISGPPVELTAKQALSLALALHELATNASKYGSLSVPGGTILITWNCHDSEGTAILRFEWRERGGPVVPVPTRRGFGSRLIEQALSSDFGAQVKLNFDPDGLVCRFESKLIDSAAGSN